jgi:hypothetical protein
MLELVGFHSIIPRQKERIFLAEIHPKLGWIELATPHEKLPIELALGYNLRGYHGSFLRWYQSPGWNPILAQRNAQCHFWGKMGDFHLLRLFLGQTVPPPTLSVG